MKATHRIFLPAGATTIAIGAIGAFFRPMGGLMLGLFGGVIVLMGLIHLMAPSLSGGKALTLHPAHRRFDAVTILIILSLVLVGLAIVTSPTQATTAFYSPGSLNGGTGNATCTTCPAGPAGPMNQTPGSPGAPGAPGAPGSAATVGVNLTQTGAPGTGAQVTNVGTANAALLDFTIPAGTTGATGPMNQTPGSKGDKGDPGNAATVQVNFTFTGAAGSNANVVNIGNMAAALFDFTIPGGINGTAGQPATVQVNKTFTGATNTTPASVTNVGTANDARLDIVIPPGPMGAAGAQGNQGNPGNPGPNQVTGATVTTLTGVICGNGALIVLCSALSDVQYMTQAAQQIITNSQNQNLTGLSSGWNTTFTGINATLNDHTKNLSGLSGGWNTSFTQINTTINAIDLNVTTSQTSRVVPNGSVTFANTSGTIPWYGLTASWGEIKALYSTQALNLTLPSAGTYFIAANIRENLTGITGLPASSWSQFALCDGSKGTIVAGTERMGLGFRPTLGPTSNITDMERGYQWIYSNSTGGTNLAICGRITGSVTGVWAVASDPRGRTTLSDMRIV